MQILGKIQNVYRASRKLRPGMRIFERCKSSRLPSRFVNSRRSATGDDILKDENRKKSASNARICSKLRIEEPDTGLILDVNLKYSFRKIPGDSLPIEDELEEDNSSKSTKQNSKKFCHDFINSNSDILELQRQFLLAEQCNNIKTKSQHMSRKSSSSSLRSSKGFRQRKTNAFDPKSTKGKYIAKVCGKIEINSPQFNSQPFSETLDSVLRNVIFSSFHTFFRNVSENNIRECGQNAVTRTLNPSKRRLNLKSSKSVSSHGSNHGRRKKGRLSADEMKSSNITKGTAESTNSPMKISNNLLNIETKLPANSSSSKITSTSPPSNTSKCKPENYSKNIGSSSRAFFESEVNDFDFMKKLAKESFALASIHINPISSRYYSRKEKVPADEIPPFYHIVSKLKEHESSKNKVVEQAESNFNLIKSSGDQNMAKHSHQSLKNSFNIADSTTLPANSIAKTRSNQVQTSGGKSDENAAKEITSSILKNLEASIANDSKPVATHEVLRKKEEKQQEDAKILSAVQNELQKVILSNSDNSNIKAQTNSELPMRKNTDQAGPTREMGKNYTLDSRKHGYGGSHKTPCKKTTCLDDPSKIEILSGKDPHIQIKDANRSFRNIAQNNNAKESIGSSNSKTQATICNSEAESFAKNDSKLRIDCNKFRIKADHTPEAFPTTPNCSNQNATSQSGSKPQSDSLKKQETPSCDYDKKIVKPTTKDNTKSIESSTCSKQAGESKFDSKEKESQKSTEDTTRCSSKVSRAIIDLKPMSHIHKKLEKGTVKNVDCSNSKSTNAMSKDITQPSTKICSNLNEKPLPECNLSSTEKYKKEPKSTDNNDNSQHAGKKRISPDTVKMSKPHLLPKSEKSGPKSVDCNENKNQPILEKGTAADKGKPSGSLPIDSVEQNMKNRKLAAPNNIKTSGAAPLQLKIEKLCNQMEPETKNPKEEQNTSKGCNHDTNQVVSKDESGNFARKDDRGCYTMGGITKSEPVKEDLLKEKPVDKVKKGAKDVLSKDESQATTGKERFHEGTPPALKSKLQPKEKVNCIKQAESTNCILSKGFDSSQKSQPKILVQPCSTPGTTNTKPQVSSMSNQVEKPIPVDCSKYSSAENVASSTSSSPLIKNKAGESTPLNCSKHTGKSSDHMKSNIIGCSKYNIEDKKHESLKISETSTNSPIDCSKCKTSDLTSGSPTALTNTGSNFRPVENNYLKSAEMPCSNFQSKPEEYQAKKELKPIDCSIYKSTATPAKTEIKLGETAERSKSVESSKNATTINAESNVKSKSDDQQVNGNKYKTMEPSKPGSSSTEKPIDCSKHISMTSPINENSKETEKETRNEKRGAIDDKGAKQDKSCVCPINQTFKDKKKTDSSSKATEVDKTKLSNDTKPTETWIKDIPKTVPLKLRTDCNTYEIDPKVSSKIDPTPSMVSSDYKTTPTSASARFLVETRSHSPPGEQIELGQHKTPEQSKTSKVTQHIATTKSTSETADRTCSNALNEPRIIKTDCFQKPIEVKPQYSEIAQPVDPKKRSPETLCSEILNQTQKTKCTDSKPIEDACFKQKTHPIGIKPTGPSKEIEGSQTSEPRGGSSKLKLPKIFRKTTEITQETESYNTIENKNGSHYPTGGALYSTASKPKTSKPVICVKQQKQATDKGVKAGVAKRIQMETKPTLFNCCLKISGPKKVEVVDCPMPFVSDESVIIKMHSVGICCSDIYMFEKGIQKIETADIRLGHEGAGEVIEVGPKVECLRKGDRVCIEAGVPCSRCKYCREGRYNICSNMQFSGLLSTYCSHPANLCHKIPETMSYEEAALVYPLSLGLQACSRGHVSVGSKVLILGACPLGLSTLMAARAMGADKIAIVDVLKKNLQIASELCADVSLVATPSMSSKELVKKILSKMKCRPNVIIDCCGCSKTVNMAVDIAEQGGHFVLAGCQTECVNLPMLTTLAKELYFHTSFRSSNMFPIAIKLIEQGRAEVTKMITHRTEFCETQTGFDVALCDMDNSAIKVMVNWLHENDCKKN